MSALILPLARRSSVPDSNSRRPIRSRPRTSSRNAPLSVSRNAGSSSIASIIAAMSSRLGRFQDRVGQEENPTDRHHRHARVNDDGEGGPQLGLGS